MTHLCWKCRGVAAAATMRELKELCRIHQPAIVFLMETRAPEERLERVRRRLRFHSMFCVEARGRSGGLGLFWNKNVQIQILMSTQNYIHTVILFIETGKEYDCSFVYGNPIFQQRRNLWSRILRLQTDRDRPWCVMGDLNEFLSHFEKDGIRPHNEGRAELFRDFLNEAELQDLDLKGCRFTWSSNPRNGIVVREKLDRVLINWPWRVSFPHAIAVALPAVSSDHSLIIFHPSPRERSGVSFKFEAMWAEHQDCMTIIQEGWQKEGNEEDPWLYMRQKAINCQKALQNWHKQTFRGTKEEIMKLKQQLNILINQESSLTDWSEFKRLQERIDTLWKQEELYWSQRSRVKWLNGGDKNTAFFHATTI